MSVTELALEHLLLRLRPLQRALRRAVEHQRRLAARLARPDAVPLCIMDDQVEALLGDVEATLDGAAPGTAAAATAEEARQEEELRRRAAAGGLRLPLDALARDLGLAPCELEAVLLCAAVELDRSWERIYAYVLDDLNRRFPCVELLAGLTAPSLAERLERQRHLGPYGKLRRTGLLVPLGESPTGARQELALGRGALDFLLTGRGEPAALFADPDEVVAQTAAGPPAGVDPKALRRLAAALAAGEVGVVGLWSTARGAAEEAGRHLLAQTGEPARRLRLGEMPTRTAEARDALERVVRAAATLGAVLCVGTDSLGGASGEGLGDLVVDVLASRRIPVLLTGRQPWRPTALLTARPYAELEIRAPGYAERKSMWAARVVGLDDARQAELAARFRLGEREVRAAVGLAEVQARFAGNGRPAPIAEHLERACGTVTRRRSQTFATFVEPKRGPDDLVLPADAHREVLEIARFSRAWPRIAEEWGFGGTITGGGGIKVLFTGESGTGKTLAAEVIAGEVGVPLVKVDLARVVSKWIGETEKNLSAAFDEAEESHAVLFFDEADALFGKRAEVERGTDRYANLEVSYLLQRLEESPALVILASNLREALDPAFTRRFQVTVHFPRPGEAERRRIWEAALPPAAPRNGLDLGALARLDMTGGSISSAARTAALLAMDERSDAIGMHHLVRAVARQFHREARLLRPADLGCHATLAQEPR